MRRALWVSSWCWVLGLGAGLGCGGSGGAEPDAGRAADAGFDGRWTSAAEVRSGPVQEFGAAVLDGELYVVGGMLEDYTVLDSVWVFDPATDTWDEAPKLPSPVHHPNVAAVDGSLYVVGALEGRSFSPVGVMWSWTPGDGAWDVIGDMPLPRGASAVGVIDGWIYIAGGVAGRAVTTFSAYHPGNDEWKADLPPLPEPRDHLVGAAVGEVFFAVGGRDTSIANLNGRVDAFTPDGAGWDERAPMITPRAGGAGSVVAGEIIVVGGEGNPNSGTDGVFAEAEAYDPETNTWRSLAPMPTPRHGMQGAAIGDAFYIPGGATAQGLSGTTAVHEVLTP